MIIQCDTHGSVEAHVDQNHNAWCQQCRQDRIAQYLSTDLGKQKLSEVLREEIRKNRFVSFSMGPSLLPKPDPTATEK